MTYKSFSKRLTVLEAKAKPRVIATWVDLMMVAELEDRGIDVDVELSPEMEELVRLANAD